MTKPKLYISSTFFDLEEHRRALIQGLSKTRCFDIVSMEYYGTRPDAPVDACLEDVKKVEFYVLLLGRRYGYIPGGRHLSITNLEYKQAIGYDGPEVYGPPDRVKCVLPFIMDPEYVLPDAVEKRIEEEEARDGEELTGRKRALLDKLKEGIRADFTLDAAFTSPSVLVAMVLSALIPALVQRGHASLVKELELPLEIVYRCNRYDTRSEFIRENWFHEGFFRIFVIHGEKKQKPMHFSNNLEYYDLNYRETKETVWNFDNFASYNPQKFLDMLIWEIHLFFFKEKLNTRNMSFDELGLKMLQWNKFETKVLKFDISFGAWNRKYQEQLNLFFDKIQEANKKLKTKRCFYILMNVKYGQAGEEIMQHHDAFIPLGPLQNVQVSHIAEWVRAHFMRQESGNINAIEDIAEEIVSAYFKQYMEREEPFSMDEANGKLKAIVSDFNDNEKPFDDYNNLFRI